MAELDLNVRVDVSGERDLRNLGASSDDAGKRIDSLSTRAVAAGSAIGAFAGGAALSLASAGLDMAIDAIGNSIELSSAKAEAASKVNVIYGDSAGKIEEAAASAADTVALSSGAYLTAAGNLGNLTTNMGLSDKAAADMSTGMIGLAADLGSFNDADTSDVLNAMQSALVGETEPMRKFGVMLDEAAVKGKAMEMGLYDGVGALDSSARANAIYALMLDQTGDAQGDLARTSDGLANKQKISAAKQEEAWTRLGDAITPLAEELMPVLADVVTAVVDVILQLVAATKEWIDKNRPLIDTVTKIAGILLDLLGKAFGVVIDLVMKLIDWNSKMLAIFGKVFDVITSIGGKIFDALIGSIKSVIDWFGSLWDGIKSAGGKVMDFLGNIFKPLSDGINTAIQIVKDVWNAFARGWNGVGINIPEIRIPNPLGGDIVMGGGRFALPSLPVLDRGGIVTGPTLAMLSANSRPEAIVPLDRMGGGLTVNVYAGVGDPVAIGREVVQAVRSYERANGPVFAPAA